MTSSSLQASTWSEMLKQIETEKRSAPPQPTGTLPAARRKSPPTSDTRYNIIRHRYEDPSREEQARRSEDKQKIDALNRARDTSLRYDSHYDIINHGSRLPPDSLGQTVSRKPISQSTLFRAFSAPTARESEVAKKYAPTFNIINNQDIKGVTASPVEQKKNPYDRKQTLQTQVEARAYDIVSGKYFHSHEQRSQHDLDVAKARAADAFYRQNVFNPVKCRFYDDEAEKRYSELQKAQSVIHGSEVLLRQPPGVRSSEGNAYNITTLAIKQPHLLETLEQKQHKAHSMGGRPKHVVEQEMRVKGVVTQEVKRLQALATRKGQPAAEPLILS